MPPQQSPHGNFDFIMNAGQKPKRSLLPGGNSLPMRLIMIAGGIFILVILIVVAMSLFSGGGGNKEVLLKVTQQQTELSRVAEIGMRDSTPPAKNIAVSTALAIQSDQRKLQNVLAANGVKISSKQLSMLRDPKTDERLKNSLAAANYDATVIQVLDEQLTAYQTSLKQAYENSKNQAVKDVLEQNFKSVNLLLKQIDAAGL